MQPIKHSLLREPKLFSKFCAKFNKDFKCKSTLGCEVVCPIYWMREIEILMNTKRVTLGEAYKMTGRIGLSRSIAEKIIEDMLGIPLEEARRQLAEEEG